MAWKIVRVDSRTILDKKEFGDLDEVIKVSNILGRKIEITGKIM